MEESQLELTSNTKVRENQVDNIMKKLERGDGGEIEMDKVDQTRDIKGTTESDSDKNLEPTISGETTTINVTKQIGQEHATLTRFTGSLKTTLAGRMQPNTLTQKRLMQHMRLSPSIRRTDQCIMVKLQKGRNEQRQMQRSYTWCSIALNAWLPCGLAS